jgi:hypothetical protein
MYRQQSFQRLWSTQQPSEDAKAAAKYIDDQIAAAVAASGTADDPAGYGPAVAQDLTALKSLYGPCLRYAPARASGPAPQPGWVVSFPDGNLAFLVSNGIVTTIIGGNNAHPSTC